MAFTIFFLILWASLSKIDEMVKAEGKIIPSDRIETVSLFEGGIIDEVLVKEGDFVQKNQSLAQLHDIAYTSEYDKNKIRLLELKAKKARLIAEAYKQPIVLDEEVLREKPYIMEYEKSLYETNHQKFMAGQSIIKEKLVQKKNDLNDALSKEKLLKQNYQLLVKEMKIKKELTQEGLISKVDFMQQMRKFNDLEVDLNTVEGSIPTLKSAIKELEKSLDENTYIFAKESKNALTEANAEIDRLYEVLSSLKDKIVRSAVVSPTEGVIKTISVKTQGATIAAGKTFIEIVPTTDYFVSEVKVKPSDIGFLHLGQSAKIKVKSYDFSIYGGLDGNISYISADTVLDDKGKEEWYIVDVQSKTNYLDKKEQLKIKAGMTVEANILTGKRTIMDYILKPILKTKQSALSER
jgi:adhesin transport system membrane fusion protein